MLNNKHETLDELKIGQTARVIKVLHDDKKLRNRFFEMGITKGVMLTIKSIAPLGDPISVIIRGYELSLRKLDAKTILVEVEK